MKPVLLCIILMMLLSTVPVFSETAGMDAQQFELVIQSPHLLPVTCFAPHPTEKIFATGSFDRTIKLWDMRGRLIRTFPGHKGDIVHISFSTDGRYIISSGRDNTTRVWTTDGKQDSSFFSHSGTPLRGWFCMDDSKLVTLGSSGGMIESTSVDQFYLRSKEGVLEKEILEYVIIGDAVDTNITPDRQHISIMDRRGIILVNLATLEFDQVLPKMGKHVFSRNNQIVAGIEQYPSYLAISAYRVQDGSPVMSVRTDDRVITDLAIDRDGKNLVICYEHEAEIWDVEKAALRLRISGFDGLEQAAFLADSTDFMVRSPFEVFLYHADGTYVTSFPLFRKAANEIYSLDIHPSGEYIARAAFRNFSLWNADGSLTASFHIGDTDDVMFPEVEFTPDGKYCAYATDSGYALIGMDGKKYREFSGEYLAGSVSPARYLITRKGNEYEFRTSTEQAPVRSITLPLFNSILINSAGTLGVAFDMERDDDKAVLFDPVDGSIITGLPGTGWISGMAISAKSALVSEFAGIDYYINNVKLFSSNGSPEQVFYGGQYSSAALSTDGSFAAIGTDTNDILVYSDTGELVRVLSGHTNKVTGLVFDPRGSRLVSTSEDDSIRIWDLEGSGCVTLLSKEKEWIAYTDDGYFDASKDGGELLGMTSGNTSFGIDQFALQYNRPDIILKKLGCSDNEMISHYYRMYEKRLKKAGFDQKSMSGAIHVPVVTLLGSRQDGNSLFLDFTLSDSLYSLERYNIYVNDVALFGTYGRVMKGRIRHMAEKVELTPGRNKVEISCINEKGAESFRALLTAYYDKQVKGDLYFIGFGVSEYGDPSLALRYAHKDIEDLASLFASMKSAASGPAYDHVYINTFINTDVTTENILSARRLLDNARPEDTLVLAISGHGVHDTDEAATYYYLTHDTDISNLKQTAAPFSLIENILQGIKPRSKLFLMDTCESGEVDDEESSTYYSTASAKGIRPRAIIDRNTDRGIGVSRKKRAYLYEKTRYIYNDLLRRSGAIVFSSSRGGEFSYESEAYKNGLFTKEIIRAIRDAAADSNNDGYVSVRELREYVSTAVPGLCGGIQNPTVDRDNISIDFGFPAGTPQ